MSSVASSKRKRVGRSTEACFRLIYRSRSLLSTDPEQGREGLADLLRVSRANNAEHGLTGALVLYEYRQRFAQVLEGSEVEVMGLFEKIKADQRHDNVQIHQADAAPVRLFSRWAMAMVLEHREPDRPLMATTDGLKEAAPWRVSAEQEVVLNQLRDLTRGYGRAY